MGLLGWLFGKGETSGKQKTLHRNPIEDAVATLTQVSRSSPNYFGDLMSASTTLARYGCNAIPAIIAGADKFPDSCDRLAGTLGAICKMNGAAISQIKGMLDAECSAGARRVIERALREVGQ